MSIETGTRLGQYEVQDLIGQGAMGLVYRAYHVQLARTGAVKFLQAISPDEDTIARFRREAQAIAQMRHPNILNVFDFGEYQGTPYMIVEYVPGGSLASRIKHSPMDMAAALEYLEGIASGLDYAHSLGIVHRDIKPANVLLEKDGTPIIADFGLAKLLQSSSVKSMTGVTTGTPAYMAPEQVTGSQIGPAADRYSLATMAYEMLTGFIPFDDEGVLELLYAQVHRDPPVPSSRRPELGSRVDAVIMRGLAKDANARWESCDAFVTALRQALGGTTTRTVERTVVMAPPGLAATVPLGQPAAPAADAAAVAVAPVPVPATSSARTPLAAALAPIGARKSHRKRNTIAAALAALLIIAVLFVGWAAATRPTVSLSSTSLPAGDHVVVSARNLPANQAGEIQLLSPVRVFPFKSDGSGNFSVDIVIPSNIGAGDHIVRICWSNACHAETTLHVTDSVGLSTPAPTPASSATPTGLLKPEVAVSQNTVTVGKPVTVSGRNFDSHRSASIVILQKGVSHTLASQVDVHTDGTFVMQVTIPNLQAGTAEIVACSINSGGASPSAGQCGAQPVTVKTS